MVCILSAAQSPLQAKLRPAIWLPGIKNLHSCNKRWQITELTPEICVQKVVNAVASLAENEKIVLHKVDRERNTVQIFSYTRAEWLDVVEIEFYPGQFSGTEGNARSFSSGFLPVWFPLSFVFNTIFFFVPFYDNQFNKKRLARIKQAMELDKLEEQYLIS
ncbi:uncharacterized protein LOC114523530 [Dendronephthya gigantea]|uniref:uncharacterized protein LOC114523530 n=1 Tax=Dendronephthya gigantea TaxID=151771 RepID=UPI00106AF1E5|nr:uncharacterized protein LOC114523530 [Dendronephthya gigantea]